MEQPARKVSKPVLPSKDEQRQLQQVETLLKSNLLHLQVDELLNQVSGSKKIIKAKISKWTESITSLISDNSTFSAITGEINHSWVEKHSIIGLELKNSFASCLEVFAKPTGVTLIGSSVYGTAVSPMLNIDIAVCMPSSVFESK